MSVVVLGATGNTGKVVAERLLQKGVRVRAVVRSTSNSKALVEKGAELATGDITDAGALTRALSGAQSAYLMIPPAPTEPNLRAYQDRARAAIVEAVRASRVPRVVVLSSVGAHQTSGTGPILGLHHLERALLGVETVHSTFLRAAYFMENLAGSLGALASGSLPSFFPQELKLDMVATRDIGDTAAVALQEEHGERARIWNLSAGSYSMQDAAHALAEITGKPVTVDVAPTAAMPAVLQGFGMSADLSELYREMTDGIINGIVKFDAGGKTVTTPTKLRDVLTALVAPR